MRGAGKLAIGLVMLALTPGARAQTLAPAPTLTPDQSRFRALYQELVETDTSATTGSCTALAGKVAGHLRQAGYTDNQITMFSRCPNIRRAEGSWSSCRARPKP